MRRGAGRANCSPSPRRTSCSAGCSRCPRQGCRSCGPMGCMRRAKRAALTQTRQMLGQAPLTVPPTVDWQTYCAQQGAAASGALPGGWPAAAAHGHRAPRAPHPPASAVAPAGDTARPGTSAAGGGMSLRRRIDLAPRVNSRGRLVVDRLPQHSSPRLSAPRPSPLPQQSPTGTGARPLPTRKCLPLQPGRPIQSP